jgi:penicillin-insensitive murein endopeptidase
MAIEISEFHEVLQMRFPSLVLATTIAVSSFAAADLPSTHAHAATAAKNLFGAKRDGAALQPAVFGSYAKGCVAGAEKLPDDGATWQAMRLSRNRHWAHPELIQLVKRLSVDGRKVGWNGLLVGDLTQPRGGPMLTGHASHQAGLDADVWLTPMPNRRLSRKEREQLSATSMLARRSNGKLTNQQIDKRRFTKAHAGIIRTAAQYRNVERIFVHPTIKRELCRQNPNRPKWLGKVRAQFGHHYHFHIRIGCPAGSPGCKPQAPVPSYGCDKASMDYWFKVAYGPPRKPKKGEKPKKRRPKRQIQLADLPRQCRVVLNAPGTGRSRSGQAYVPSAESSQAARAIDSVVIEKVALPTFRPLQGLR